MNDEDTKSLSVTQCSWPSGVCECWAQEQLKPDPYGRVWMHCEEGLALNKASMGRFMVFCLANRVELGSVYAINPRYKRSTVLAPVRLRPDQFAAFEAETGGKLREPPRVKLNSATPPVQSNAQHEGN